MTILVIEPERKPVIAEVNGSLDSMQKVVGGFIEASYPFDEQVALICNEEGKLNNLPLNRALYHPETNKMYDIVSGTFFICGAKVEEDSFSSLTQEQIQTYTKMFQQPELFLFINGTVVALPMECL
ncbi:DUF3846 domain-containing protein [Anaerotignum sp.]|uniref:DUF3846 domain-containing protein n=1 Tax=Anaerotignum sp. TaxID=2039241 RepID=UPI0028ACD030|nr:DUF3846 domain-containing protein [Anaerotignum sp.]